MGEARDDAELTRVQWNRREVVVISKIFFGTGRKDPNQKVRSWREEWGSQELILGLGRVSLASTSSRVSTTRSSVSSSTTWMFVLSIPGRVARR